jgi:arylsulfatase A-like enzyme
VSNWEVTTGDPAALYLPGALRDAGYLTAAFVHNPWLRPYFGFGQGLYTMRPYHGRAIDGVALALGWLSDHVRDPSFLLLHLMDPHWPYDAPPGFGPERRPCWVCDSLLFSQYGQPTLDDRAELRRRYSAEVTFTDVMLGQFYDTLLAAGALDHTWLIITSDHGEEFWEHGGFLHGHTLYDELLRVPLVVVPPRSDATARRGVRVDSQVRLEDVAASMLEIAGIDPARATDGRSLLALVGGKPDGAARTSVGGYIKSTDDLSYSVRRWPWKAIVAPEMSRNRLFRLDVDAQEKRSLLFNASVPEAQRSELSQRFLGLATDPARLGIDVSRRRVQRSGASPDADTERGLRSLGYAD